MDGSVIESCESLNNGGHRLYLPSFPTRRSSDLDPRPEGMDLAGGAFGSVAAGRADDAARTGEEERSEEHTSELQSQSNLVCRLLLEKKKWLLQPRPTGPSTRSIPER